MTEKSIITLRKLVGAIIEEAEVNEAFANKLDSILNADTNSIDRLPRPGMNSKRGANRRDPAVIDPIEILQTKGETDLREELNKLTIKELKDIIADYGMDPSKLAMKWKDEDRIKNHIVDISIRRAGKGDAFRDSGV